MYIFFMIFPVAGNEKKKETKKKKFCLAERKGYYPDYIVREGTVS